MQHHAVPGRSGPSGAAQPHIPERSSVRIPHERMPLLTDRDANGCPVTARRRGLVVRASSSSGPLPPGMVRGRCSPSLDTRPSLRGQNSNFNTLSKHGRLLQACSAGFFRISWVGGLRGLGVGGRPVRLDGGGEISDKSRQHKLLTQWCRPSVIVDPPGKKKPRPVGRVRLERATSGTRTLDFSFTKAALYRLS